MGDLGVNSSIIRFRPNVSGTNLAPQLLIHNRAQGICINGTEACYLTSPITIPAANGPTDYRITATPGAVPGTNLHVSVARTNGSIISSGDFYVPKLASVKFFSSNVSVTATCGKTTNMFLSTAAGTNVCRVYMTPIQYPDPVYLSAYSKYLQRTDWLLAKVTGAGATPAQTTLNELDYRSAFADYWYFNPENSWHRPATRRVQI